jgi:hypothetical protein
MPSVRPKTIVSGGISPKGWTSVFTLLLVMVGNLPIGGRGIYSCIQRAKDASLRGNYAMETIYLKIINLPVKRNRAPR